MDPRRLGRFGSVLREATRRHPRLWTGVLSVATVAITVMVLFIAADLSGLPGLRARDPNRAPSSVATGLEPLNMTRAQTADVHHDLHVIARVCGPGSRDRSRLVADPASTILRFARRWPDARFPIHDEVGTSVSLLMVTREALKSCAPRWSRAANLELPTQYRSPVAVR